MKRVLKIVIIVILALSLGLLISLLMKGSDSQKMDTASKLTSTSLAKLCPDKPNCVSSLDEGAHFIETKDYSINPLNSFKVPADCDLKSAKSNHKHFHCISPTFGFVDDLEVFFEDGKLYYYSASRVGYSDLDANRKRVEKIKKLN